MPSPLRASVHQLRSQLPGTGLACVLALAATFVSSTHGGPQLLYALLFGTAFHYLSDEPRTKAGIDFCSRSVLRLGVGLLGARITAEQIVGLGWQTAGVVVVAVVTTIACGALLGRRLGMTHAQGVLSGAAVAICGASAALAVSAVLPREKHGERFTLMVVVTVTVMSTLAMVLYPLAARLLELPPALAGLFLGGTIHDVAQVVGAGYMLGRESGDVATVVKLFRVSMLAVVVLAVSAAFKASRNRAQTEQRQARPGGALPRRQPLVPWFLWMFVVMVAANSAGLIGAELREGANTLSRACLVVAIAALGVKTSLGQLARTGWRPFALMLAETLWIATVVLIAVLLMAPGVSGSDS